MQTPQTVQDSISSPLRRAEFVEAALGELAKLDLPMVRLANLPADSVTARIMKDAAGQHGYVSFSGRLTGAPRSAWAL